MFFLTLANHEQIKNKCLESQKFQILSVGGNRSAKMKKGKKFSLFVRATSTCVNHRSYFTSLITFRQLIIGSKRTERIILQHKDKQKLQAKEASWNKPRLRFF